MNEFVGFVETVINNIPWRIYTTGQCNSYGGIYTYHLYNGKSNVHRIPDDVLTKLMNSYYELMKDGSR